MPEKHSSGNEQSEREKRREYNRKYYQERRGEENERCRKYYEENKDAILERSRRYHREWYQRNKTKCQEVEKSRYQRDPEKAKRDGRKRYLENKAFTDELKATIGCQVCGEKDPACLQFHHRDREEKFKNVAQLWSSRERLEEEVRKCDVLCANCHYRLHSQDRSVFDRTLSTKGKKLIQRKPSGQLLMFGDNHEHLS